MGAVPASALAAPADDRRGQRRTPPSARPGVPERRRRDCSGQRARRRGGEVRSERRRLGEPAARRPREREGGVAADPRLGAHEAHRLDTAAASADVRWRDDDTTAVPAGGTDLEPGAAHGPSGVAATARVGPASTTPTTSPAATTAGAGPAATSGSAATTRDEHQPVMSVAERSSLERHAFRGLGGTVELLLAERRGAPSLWAAVEALVERLEAKLSRFRPTSALSVLNRHGFVHGEHELAAVASLAVEARQRTGGLFDPTVHHALLAWGYDRSFGDDMDSDAPVPERRSCGAEVEIDLDTGTVRVEEGAGLDLGGIAKGFVVDRAAELLSSAGRCLVNAGGDLAIGGDPGDLWPVGVETSTGPRVITLERGALATSGTVRRNWRRGALRAHHLIDPRTGAPSTSDLLQVTVTGASAVHAEVSAKTLFLLGADGAVAAADRDAIPALLVTRAGATVVAGGMP